MTNEKLLEKNLAYFNEAFPSVANTVKKHSNPYSKIVFEDGQAIDIDLGTSRLYKTPVTQFVHAQIKNFMEKPEKSWSIIQKSKCTFDTVPCESNKNG